MEYQNSINSQDEYDSGVQFEDSLQIPVSNQPRFSLISTNEDQEQIMEMFNPKDEEADRYIERMYEIKRGSTDCTLDEALDESFLRELSVLKMYPAKKPKKKEDDAKESKGILGKLKSKFRKKSDTIAPTLPQISVISQDFNDKPMPDIVVDSQPEMNAIKIDIEVVDEDEAPTIPIDSEEMRERTMTLEHPPVIDFYTLDVPENGKLPHSYSHRASLAELVLDEARLSRSSLPSLPEQHKIPICQEDDDPPPTGIGGRIKNMFSCKKDPNKAHERKLLGWVEGVFVRCVSNIFGVMLYLRISWMAAQAGLLWGSVIILASSVITMVTALSTSAICTNGVVTGGGIYFLISRSIGPEFGGSIGIIFAITNGFGAAMYLVGMAETLQDIFNSYDFKIIDGGINDIRIIGLAFCVMLVLVVYAGTNFESKTQVILQIIIGFSVIDYYIGTFIHTDKKDNRGFTGYSFETLRENFMPDFRAGYTIISVFAVYFPAATGIMAGANISGDLKNPGKAIPLGTVLAIIITSIIYFTFLWASGATFVKDSDGTQPPFKNGTSEWVKPACYADRSCKYGIMNDYQAVQISSLWGPLIVAGVICSTLSSALSCMVSGPKLFQVVCKDKLFPYIGWFGQGYGPNHEPRKAYALFFVLACAIICIGELNAIAPFITNFYLGTYALVNYACFDCAFSRSPSFRPSFKYWNKWLSLACAFVCVGCMIVISWYTSLATLGFFFALYLYLWKWKPAVNWGTSDQAHAYRNAMHSLNQLNRQKLHVKSYRPQLLVMTGNPASRPSLVDFAYSISKGTSLMMCGNIVPIRSDEGTLSMVKSLNAKTQSWLKTRKIKAYSLSIANRNVREGTRALMQATGLGHFRPNVLFMGYKQNWDENGMRGIHEINEYVGLINDAFESNMSVSILRNCENGLDLTDLMANYNLVKVPAKPRGSIPFIAQRSRAKTMLIAVSKSSFEDYNDTKSESSESEEESESDTNSEMSDDSSKNLEEAYGRNSEQKGLVIRINQFRTKVKKGIIDVWWIYDDGGLTLLLPYLMTQRNSYLDGAQLRIFTLATHAGRLDADQESMVKLLKKFRIDHVKDVTVFANVQTRPDEEMISEFESIITLFRVPERGHQTSTMITQTELLNQQDRTWRYLRVASLLRQHSSDADLVVLTMPVPRKGHSSALYMAWLEIMSRDLPPTLLVRGNQTNVLTFYS